MFRERMYRDFFLRKFYKEKYGKPFPDSVNDLCGRRKMIGTGDVSVIL
jgi:hypothetical protein